MGLSRTGKGGNVCPSVLTMPLIADSDCDGQHTFVLCVQPCEGASRKGTHIAKIALLGNYMATSFVTAALITNSNLVGCSTGMSAGLTPRKSLTSC